MIVTGGGGNDVSVGKTGPKPVELQALRNVRITMMLNHRNNFMLCFAFQFSMDACGALRLETGHWYSSSVSQPANTSAFGWISILRMRRITWHMGSPITLA